MTKDLFNREEYADFLIRNGCVNLLFDNIFYISKERRKTPYHIKFDNLQEIGLMKKLSSFISDFLKDEKVNIDNTYFIGVPEGATVFAWKLTELKGNGNIVTARKTPIEFAQIPADRYFKGRIREDDRVIYVEDSITTGDSLSEQIKIAREFFPNLEKAIIFCDRREFASLEKGNKISATERLKREGIEPLILSTIHDLLPKVIKKCCPKNIQYVERAIQYYEMYGVDFAPYKEAIHVRELNLYGLKKKNLYPHECPLFVKGLVDEGILTLEETKESNHDSSA